METEKLIVLNGGNDKQYKRPTLWLDRGTEFIKLGTFTNDETKDLFLKYINDLAQGVPESALIKGGNA